MENIIDLILDMQDKVTCFDYSKTKYVMMARGLMHESCKFHEHMSTNEDIKSFLGRHLDAKNELIIHLFGFMNLIEQLDAELKKQIGDGEHE